VFCHRGHGEHGGEDDFGVEERFLASLGMTRVERSGEWRVRRKSERVESAKVKEWNGESVERAAGLAGVLPQRTRRARRRR
jgi:hypothetical protein